MSEVLKMSSKERSRKGLFELVKQGKLTIKQAALQCGLSYRQGRRVYRAYVLTGDAGLVHKSRDQQSNRKHPHREAIVSLYQEKYEGFGPTLASEYLSKNGYRVDHETLRRWLVSEGLWKKQRKRKVHHPRRERRAQFGELLQIDGSIHDWFDEGKHSCLLNIVDDATGKTLSMMDSGETTSVIFRALWKWIETYGIPLAVYVDLKTAYISPKEGQQSHFQKACEKLGIEVIRAYSPQAKGRVERNHRVYQDRFIKALHLHGIQTIETANQFLADEFLSDLNQRFERIPKNPHSAHRPLGKLDLNQIFALEYERKVQHDWTFSFEGQIYQIKKERGETIAPKSRIYIRQHLDGRLSIWHHEKRIHAIAIAKEQQLLYRQAKQRSLQSKPHPKERIKPLRSNSGLFQPNYSTKQREREIQTGHSMPYGH